MDGFASKIYMPEDMVAELMRVIPVLCLAIFGAGCLGSWGATGHSASIDTPHALVLSFPFPSLTIQVDFLSSNPPTQEALLEMLDVLHAETLKKNIRMLDPALITSTNVHRNGTVWTIEEVRAAHNATFRLGNDPEAVGSGDEAFLHVLYLDSTLRFKYLGTDTTATGVHSGNFVALFTGPDPARGAAPPLPDEVRKDNVNLIHEIGHALGLVNSGAPMVRDHALPDDPHHSRNGDSIMWAGTDIVGFAQRNVGNREKHGVALFDADDLADLAALRAEQR